MSLRPSLSRVGARAFAVRAALTLLAPCLALSAGSVSAQEGHPLKGSWIGEWESNEAHGESVLLVLNWDGDAITGVINPGTDDIEIENATLDPADWSIHIEASAQADGQTLSYVIDGRIEELELPNRTIVGTWRHDDGSGDFAVQRQ